MTLYWDWVRSEAALIDSDGCTGVSGFFLECCHEHDLAFWYAKDPRDAYRRWCEHGDRERAWREAVAIGFEFANSRFKKCHQQRSKWGAFWWLNPVIWWRWRAVVRLRLARSAWDKHRAREQEAAGV